MFLVNREAVARIAMASLFLGMSNIVGAIP
jgi:hypothetical protein